MKTIVEICDDETVVSLIGCLDFETMIPFKDQLIQLLSDSNSRQYVFDFTQLNFVGSSGITPFILALRDFNQRASKCPIYVNVPNDFKKIIGIMDQSRSFQFVEEPQKRKTQAAPSRKPMATTAN